MNRSTTFQPHLPLAIPDWRFSFGAFPVIRPSTTPTPSEVARHYDELDRFYRQVWGEHVHHGVWFPGNDPAAVEEATERLLYLTAKPLRLLPGSRVADIGCGYGASSRWLAESFGADVTGLTLSGVQVNAARNHPAPRRGRVRYDCADWLDNTLPDGSLDAAIAIETLAHMPDKTAFFDQVHRTLQPGGRVALACWTSASDLAPLDAVLLRMICAEGQLSGIGTVDDYRDLATRAGFSILGDHDLSAEVEPTWWIITRRVVHGAFTRPDYLVFLLRRLSRQPVYLLTLPRLLLAYRTGALRYSLLWLRKPAEPVAKV